VTATGVQPEGFFTTHHGDLTRLARRLTGDADAADDLAAEAWLQMWQCWERVCTADNPPAYARGIVVTLAHNRLRPATAGWSPRSPTWPPA
jgi:DNA-directed RNA polymerase specialized sigma24 family protein